MATGLYTRLRLCLCLWPFQVPRTNNDKLVLLGD